MANETGPRRGTPPAHSPGTSTEHCIMQDFGYFGHFMHVHSGGRSGKQHMLIKLCLAGGTLQQRDIQNSEPISSASLSEVLTKLERESLIVRTRSERDRRQLDITLTEAGWKEAELLAARRQQFESQAFSILAPEERTQLLSTLDRLVGHWNDIEEEREGKKAMPE